MKLISRYNRVNLLVTTLVLLLSAVFYYFFVKEMLLIHSLLFLMTDVNYISNHWERCKNTKPIQNDLFLPG